MFEIGKEYRVWLVKDGMSSREGVLVERDGPMFMLDVEGVRTIFHMATVTHVELVDRDAEDARSKAAHEARMKAWS